MYFSSYFEKWLHQNYYKAGVNIGKKGDFYTSVSVGSIFGICIAKHILKISQNFDGKVSLVEIGANEGYLLCDIIQAIYTFDKNIIEKFEFVIIEPHEILEQKQKDNFNKSFGENIKIKHFKNIKDVKFDNVIFLTNELFDSFSCEIFDNGKMLFVEDDKFLLKEASKQASEFSKKFDVKKGEIPTNQESFVKDICESAQKFYFLTFDYGHLETKNEFSLRIYKNHNVYNFFEVDNIKDYFGCSDLTYNVNFSILKKMFEKFGCKIVDYKTQAKAIVDFGGVEVLDFIYKNGGQVAYENAVNQFKMLIDENFFGEKFKMLEVSKGI